VPVLVIFGRLGADRAKSIAPIVEEIAASMRGKLKVTKAECRRSSGTASAHGIRGIPEFDYTQAAQSKNNRRRRAESETRDASRRRCSNRQTNRTKARCVGH